MPEQIKELEQFLNKSWKEMLGKELAIDAWLNSEEENILLLSPNMVENNKIQYPFNPIGMCVFYKDARCSIYPVRPYECAVPDHNTKPFNGHKEIAMEWKDISLLQDYKDKIVFDNFSLGEMFEMLMKGFYND